MNIINNQKALARLWSALYCDFESLLAKYMGSGWKYSDFAKVCREMQITLVMHITQGRGKTKDEHYYLMTNMIFQLCKELWLRAEDLAKNRSKITEDKNVELKRGLGAFFLLYTMFEKQPIRDKVKIAMDLDDMKALAMFCDGIQTLPLPIRNQFNFILENLLMKEAFHYCAYAEGFRFDGGTRHFLNHSRSEIVSLTRRMRDVQDVLAYSSIHDKVGEQLETLAKANTDFTREVLMTVSEGLWQEHVGGGTTYPSFGKSVTGNKMTKAFDKLGEIVDQPIVTLQALTATDAIEKRMMMETRKRMERARKKAMQNMGRSNENKTTKAYVREGGIFGRKKETDENEDKTKRRERGACNGNLWIYINGLDFDKPLGGEPKQNQNHPSSSAPKPGPSVASSSAPKPGPSGVGSRPKNTKPN